MNSLGDLADWWDEQRRFSSAELDRFVDNNPNLFGVVVATAAHTAMDIGAGWVDVLRFGEGMAEGGVAGVGTDALRLVGVMGPVGRAAKLAQTATNARLARLIVDPGGPICGWVSGAQALRQTGTRAFASVDDLARALGKSVGDLGGSRLLGRVSLFRQLGARIQGPWLVHTFDDIGRVTRADGSVTMFNVFGQRMSQGGMTSFGHAVYAYRDHAGRLRILDRGGRQGLHGAVVDSLEELGAKYGAQGPLTLHQAAVMDNVFAKWVGSVSNLPVLALNVYTLAAVNSADHETVAQAFEVHKAVMRGGRSTLEGAGARFHTVVSGDSLGSIAVTYYGDRLKWPVIYESNRELIGGNPNLVRAGQRLLVPSLPLVGS